MKVMRYLVQLAPHHSTMPASCRLAILDDTARATATGSGPTLLESLRGCAVAGLGLLVWLACAAAPQPQTAPVAETPASFIVQGTDLATVIAAVRQVGAEMTHELAVIRAVGARLTASQRAQLEALPGITRVWEDRPVGVQAPPAPPAG